MTRLKPDLPERFDRQHGVMAEHNIMRRKLGAEPTGSHEFGLQWEYVKLLPTPSGLHLGWVWVADSGDFEKPMRVGDVVAEQSIPAFRDLTHNANAWLQWRDEEQDRRSPLFNPWGFTTNPWVCIDTAEQDYCIWKSTGAIYLYDRWDGAADEPIWAPAESQTGV